MSYDIELKNKVTGETAKMRHPQYVRGGTVRAVVDERTGQLVQAEQTEADINITCNYSHYYYEATDGDPRFAHDEVSAYYADGTQGPIKTEYGIRGLYGKTPAESIPMLMDMIVKIKQKYTDENGEDQEVAVDAAFVLEWYTLNDIRLNEKTDVLLYFSREAKDVSVIRYEPSLKKQSTEETEENDEPESELIKVSEEEDENGKKQFILKDLLDEGIYLVTAEFDQGTVEYGFEVKKNAKSS